MGKSTTEERQLELFSSSVRRLTQPAVAQASPDFRGLARTEGTKEHTATCGEPPTVTLPPPHRDPHDACQAPPISRARQLEAAIRRRLGPETRVRFTDTRSTLLSQSIRRGARTVRVHQLFLDADAHTLENVVEFLASGARQAGRVVDAFIAQQDHLLAHHVVPRDREAARGHHHDLLPIFTALNAAYFESRIDADIHWGLHGSFRGRTRRSITFGTYDYRARRITIHPVLDQAHVPPLCVARIVHHEMCHAMHPAERGAAGRRLVHGPAFRQAEAQFVGAAEADLWFEQHLSSLLRYRQR